MTESNGSTDYCTGSDDLTVKGTGVDDPGPVKMTLVNGTFGPPEALNNAGSKEISGSVPRMAAHPAESNNPPDLPNGAVCKNGTNFLRSKNYKAGSKINQLADMLAKRSQNFVEASQNDVANVLAPSSAIHDPAVEVPLQESVDKFPPEESPSLSAPVETRLETEVTPPVALEDYEISTKVRVVKTRTSPRCKTEADSQQTDSVVKRGKTKTQRRSKQVVETSTQTADIQFISIRTEEVCPPLPLATPIESLTFVCLYCHSTFSEKRDCKTHELAHSQKRKTKCIKCQFCSKKLPNLDELKTHAMHAHSSQFHFCQECDVRFADEANLADHNNVEHVQANDTTAEKSPPLSTKKVKLLSPALNVDVSFEGLKKPSPSPRSTLRQSPKDRTDEQLEAEMLFYSHLSGNIQENLAKHLDGKIGQGDNTVADSTDQSKTKTGGLLSLVPSSTTAVPVCRAPSPYQTRSKTPNPLPLSAKKFKKLPNWQQKFWEKYNFPTSYRYEHRFWDKNYLNIEKSSLYLKDLSCLDIKTQLTMRENAKKLEESNSLLRTSDEQEKCPAFPCSLNLTARQVVTNSVTETVVTPPADAVVPPVKKGKGKKKSRPSGKGSVVTRLQSGGESGLQRKGSLDLSSDKKTILRRQTSLENLDGMKTTPAVTEVSCSNNETEERDDVVPEASEISGEWVRPRSYLCGACFSRFNNLWELEDHKWASHPNVWCNHYEFDDDKLKNVFKLEGTAPQVPEIKLPDLYRRYLEPKGALNSAEAQPVTSFPQACSKCRKTCTNMPDLHKHMLDCGGDTTWSLTMYSSPNPNIKRKWRPFGSRRRKQIGRRCVKRSVPPTPVPRNYNTQPKIRTKPGDVETIQKMLANLPEKRTRRAINFDEISTRSQATIQNNRLLRKRLQTTFTNSFMRKKSRLQLNTKSKLDSENGSKSGTSSDASLGTTPVPTPPPRRKYRLNEVKIDITPVDLQQALGNSAKNASAKAVATKKKGSPTQTEVSQDQPTSKKPSMKVERRKAAVRRKADIVKRIKQKLRNSKRVLEARQVHQENRQQRRKVRSPGNPVVDSQNLTLIDVEDDNATPEVVDTMTPEQAESLPADKAVRRRAKGFRLSIKKRKKPRVAEKVTEVSADDSLEDVPLVVKKTEPMISSELRTINEKRPPRKGQVKMDADVDVVNVISSSEDKVPLPKRSGRSNLKKALQPPQDAKRSRKVMESKSPIEIPPVVVNCESEPGSSGKKKLPVRKGRKTLPKKVPKIEVNESLRTDTGTGANTANTSPKSDVLKIPEVVLKDVTIQKHFAEKGLVETQTFTVGAAVELEPTIILNDTLTIGEPRERRYSSRLSKPKVEETARSSDEDSTAVMEADSPKIDVESTREAVAEIPRPISRSKFSFSALESGAGLREKCVKSSTEIVNDTSVWPLSIRRNLRKVHSSSDVSLLNLNKGSVEELNAHVTNTRRSIRGRRSSGGNMLTDVPKCLERTESNLERTMHSTDDLEEEPSIKGSLEKLVNKESLTQDTRRSPRVRSSGTGSTDALCVTHLSERRESTLGKLMRSNSVTIKLGVERGSSYPPAEMLEKDETKSIRRSSRNTRPTSSMENFSVPHDLESSESFNDEGKGLIVKTPAEELVLDKSVVRTTRRSSRGKVFTGESSVEDLKVSHASEVIEAILDKEAVPRVENTFDEALPENSAEKPLIDNSVIKTTRRSSRGRRFSDDGSMVSVNTEITVQKCTGKEEVLIVENSEGVLALETPVIEITRQSPCGRRFSGDAMAVDLKVEQLATESSSTPDKDEVSAEEVFLENPVIRKTTRVRKTNREGSTSDLNTEHDLKEVAFSMNVSPGESVVEESGTKDFRRSSRGRRPAFDNPIDDLRYLGKVLNTCSDISPLKSDSEEVLSATGSEDTTLARATRHSTRGSRSSIHEVALSQQKSQSDKFLDSYKEVMALFRIANEENKRNRQVNIPQLTDESDKVVSEETALEINSDVLKEDDNTSNATKNVKCNKNRKKSSKEVTKEKTGAVVSEVVTDEGETLKLIEPAAVPEIQNDTSSDVLPKLKRIIKRKSKKVANQKHGIEIPLQPEDISSLETDSLISPTELKEMPVLEKAESLDKLKECVSHEEFPVLKPFEKTEENNLLKVRFKIVKKSKKNSSLSKVKVSPLKIVKEKAPIVEMPVVATRGRRVLTDSSSEPTLVKLLNDDSSSDCEPLSKLQKEIVSNEKGKEATMESVSDITFAPEILGTACAPEMLSEISGALIVENTSRNYSTSSMEIHDAMMEKIISDKLNEGRSKKRRSTSSHKRGKKRELKTLRMTVTLKEATLKVLDKPATPLNPCKWSVSAPVTEPINFEVPTTPETIPLLSAFPDVSPSLKVDLNLLQNKAKEDVNCKSPINKTNVDERVNVSDVQENENPVALLVADDVPKTLVCESSVAPASGASPPTETDDLAVEIPPDEPHRSCDEILFQSVVNVTNRDQRLPKPDSSFGVGARGDVSTTEPTVSQRKLSYAGNMYQQSAELAEPQPMDLSMDRSIKAVEKNSMLTVQEATSSEDGIAKKSNVNRKEIANAPKIAEADSSAMADDECPPPAICEIKVPELSDISNEMEQVVSSTVHNPKRKRRTRIELPSTEISEDVPSTTLMVPEELDRRSRRRSKEVPRTNEFIIDDPLILVDELWSELDSDSDSNQRRKVKRIRKRAVKKKDTNTEIDLEALLRNFGANKPSEGKETDKDQQIKCLRKKSSALQGPTSRQRIERKVVIKENGYKKLSLRLFTFYKKVLRYGHGGSKLLKVKKILYDTVTIPQLSLSSAEITENPEQVIVCSSSKVKGKKTAQLIEQKIDVNVKVKVSLPLDLLGDLSVLNNNNGLERAENLNVPEVVHEMEASSRPITPEVKVDEPKLPRSEVIDKIFSCEICETYYYTASHLKNHKMSNRHKQKEAEIREVSPIDVEEEPKQMLLEDLAPDTSVKTAVEEEKNSEDTSEMPVLEGPFIATGKEPRTELPPIRSLFGFSEESLRDFQKAIGCTDEEMLILSLLGENTGVDPDKTEVERQVKFEDISSSIKGNGVLESNLKQRMTSALAGLVNRAVNNLLKKSEAATGTAKNEKTAFLSKLSDLNKRKKKTLLQLARIPDEPSPSEKKEKPTLMPLQGRYKYQCTICGNRFEKESTRDYHLIRSHHQSKRLKSSSAGKSPVGEMTPPSEEWNDSWLDVDDQDQCQLPSMQFLCSDCGINFTSPKEVRDHQRLEHPPSTSEDASGVKPKKSDLNPDQERLLANQELQKLSARRYCRKLQGNQTLWGSNAIKYKPVKADCSSDSLNVVANTSRTIHDISAQRDAEDRFKKIVDNNLKRKAVDEGTIEENAQDGSAWKPKRSMDVYDFNDSESEPEPVLLSHTRKSMLPATATKTPSDDDDSEDNLPLASVITPVKTAEPIPEYIPEARKEDTMKQDIDNKRNEVLPDDEVADVPEETPESFKISLESRLLRLDEISLKKTTSSSSTNLVDEDESSKVVSDIVTRTESSLSDYRRTSEDDSLFRVDSVEEISENVIYRRNDSDSSYDSRDDFNNDGDIGRASESDESSISSEGELGESSVSDRGRRTKKIVPLLTATLTNNARSSESPKPEKEAIVKKIWNRQRAGRQVSESSDESQSSEIDKETIMKRIWKKKRAEAEEEEKRREEMKINQTEVSDEVVIKCGPKPKMVNRRKSANETAKDMIVTRIWSGKCGFQTKAALKTYDSEIVPAPVTPAKRRGRPASVSHVKKKRVVSASEDDLDSLLEEIEQENVEKAIRLEFLHLRRTEKSQIDNSMEPAGLFTETNTSATADKKRKRIKRNVPVAKSREDLTDLKNRRHHRHRHRRHHDGHRKHKRKRSRRHKLSKYRENPGGIKVLERMCEDIATRGDSEPTTRSVSAGRIEDSRISTDLDNLDSKIDEVLSPLTGYVKRVNGETLAFPSDDDVSSNKEL